MDYKLDGEVSEKTYIFISIVYYNRRKRNPKLIFMLIIND